MIEVRTKLPSSIQKDEEAVTKKKREGHRRSTERAPSPRIEKEKMRSRERKVLWKDPERKGPNPVILLNQRIIKILLYAPHQDDKIL